MPVHLVALVCALATPPADCNERTALQTIVLPAAKNELGCMYPAQATAAGLAIGPREGEYLKTECTRLRR
jgi:hypothetical protein